MKRSTQHKTSLIYYLLVIVLFLLQAVYTFHSMNQIRYEELAESVRNVFWFQSRLIFDGVSSNVGWYMILLPIYNIFGFSVFTAKYVRLGLHLISLFCLADVLKRFLGWEKALLPLSVIGLSPALLYFNTLQAQYGIDLQYLPICLFLAMQLQFKKRYQSICIQILLWSIAMIASMSYPMFIFFLPAIGLVYLIKLYLEIQKKNKQFILLSVSVSLMSFILPLLFSFFYIKNRELFIYDERNHGGIFRGAGRFVVNGDLFLHNLLLNGQNFFMRAFGYYYELKKVEFSDIYPLVIVLYSLLACFYLFKKVKKLRKYLLVVGFTLALNVLIANFTYDPTPGIRRSTATIAALYAIFTFGWYFTTHTKWKHTYIQIGLYSLTMLLLFHHTMAYPINLLHLKEPSVYADRAWFAQKQNPQESLNFFVQGAQKENIQLLCVNSTQENSQECRYAEIYTAIMGSCYWNKLNCKSISGYDLQNNRFIPLSLNLWQNTNFEHSVFIIKRL